MLSRLIAVFVFSILVSGCLESPPRLNTSEQIPETVEDSAPILSKGDYWLSAMTINAEWLWDFDDDIDGNVLDADDIPSIDEYWEEIEYFASLIEDNGATIVALQEIEGCHIADDLRSVLETGVWHTICLPGRDTFTGQDVAIISQFPVVYGPTTFPDTWGEYGESRVRPSKIIGAVVDTPHGRMAVIATHLLSKLNPANDERRAAQADAVLTNYYYLAEQPGVVHGLVMGDLNDTPGSVPLTVLTSTGTLKNTLYAGGRVATAVDCSYTFQGQCDLIDHILKTDSLGGGEFSVISTDRKYTDHQAVAYRLELAD